MLADNLHDVLWITTPDSQNVLYVNRTYEKLWGRTRESLYQNPQTFMEAIHPEDRERIEAQMQHGRGETWNLEYRIVREDGSVRWIHDRGFPIHDDQGGTRWMCGVARDVTESKHLEYELREQEELLKETQRIAGIGGWKVDVASGMVTWTDQTCRMHGLPAGHRPTLEEAIGYFAKESIPRLRESIDRAIRDAEGFDLELELITAQNTRLWGRALGHARQRDGETVELYGTLEDITERKSAQKKLEDERNRFYAVLEAIPVYVFLQDMAHQIRYANQRFKELFGSPNTRRTCEMLHGRPTPCEVCPIFEGVSTKAVHVWEWTDLSGRVFMVYDCPLRDMDGEQLVLELGIDITELRRVEEENRQRRSEVERMSRLHITGELASGLAHELNQPLTAILSGAELAQRLSQDGACPEPELHTVIAEIANQAERAGRILRHLRSFVGRKGRSRSTVHINDVVRRAAELFRADCRIRNIQLIIDLADGLTCVLADSVQLEHVVLNLARNGMDAMSAVNPGNRCLTIKTAQPDPAHVEIAIMDTGIGLTQNDIEHIFNPFYSTKEHGMGLGLSLTRSIIEDHAGNIRVSDNPAGGACFRVILPIKGEDVS